MKPLGLTPFLRVIHPTPAEDAVWECVERVHGSMTVERFLKEAREAWAYQDSLEAENNQDAFKKGMTP